MAPATELRHPGGAGDYAREVNVGQTERIASILGGAVLAFWGLGRGRLVGWTIASLGGALVYRGFGGHCPAYGALGIDRSDADGRQGNLGVKIERAVVVTAPPGKLFAFWRRLDNLPRFMSNVESVEVLSPTRSRWRIRGPIGVPVRWEAEIINEVPDEVIAWRTVDNAVVAHAGSVRFEPGPAGGTLVRVSLQYDPIGGGMGHDLVELLGRDPGRQIEDDLNRFKHAMETAA